MSFDPNYGETLLPYDELEYLTAQMRALLGEPVRKGDVYDLEQAVWAQVAASRLTSALRGVLQIDEILTDHFVRELHTELYGPIWTWAGRHRILQTNIGIAPERIAVELRSQIDDLAWRWQHTDDISSRALRSLPSHDRRSHPSVYRRQRTHQQTSRRPGVRRDPGRRRADGVRLGPESPPIYPIAPTLRSDPRRTTIGRLRPGSTCRRSMTPFVARPTAAISVMQPAVLAAEVSGLARVPPDAPGP